MHKQASKKDLEALREKLRAAEEAAATKSEEVVPPVTEDKEEPTQEQHSNPRDEKGTRQSVSDEEEELTDLDDSDDPDVEHEADEPTVGEQLKDAWNNLSPVVKTAGKWLLGAAVSGVALYAADRSQQDKKRSFFAAKFKELGCKVPSNLSGRDLEKAWRRLCK